VGFGGSMLWFGSSAGVALSNLYPEAKSAVAWIRAGWYVGVAYVAGFAVMLLIHPWQADPPHGRAVLKAAPAVQQHFNHDAHNDLKAASRG
jgi:hypothetical protein